MDRTGFAPKDDDLGVRWVTVRHAPDHIHIVATLARQDGAGPSVWDDFYRLREACQSAERRLRLRATSIECGATAQQRGFLWPNPSSTKASPTALRPGIDSWLTGSATGPAPTTNGRFTEQMDLPAALGLTAHPR